ncbi:MAG: diacylglycerol O-acyltransferase [Gammaproteobacteria bacterium]|jgi:diacylglycerol O-acyltransferase
MRLTETDASFIYMESVSGPMHISSIYVLDGEVPFDKILKRFESIIHLVPAYRRKLAQIPFSLGHPKMVDDATFRLENHVICHQLAEGTSLEEGVNVGVELNEPMLDRNLPLWKFVVLTGVPGKTLILQQTHHALIDGASGIDLTTILYDLDPNAGNPEPPAEGWHPEPAQSAANLMAEAIQENLSNLTKINPFDVVSNSRGSFDRIKKATEVFTKFMRKPAITAPFNSGVVGPKRRVKWLKKPFTEIREIRRHLGGTINDVVLAVVSEAVSRYLDAKNEKVDDKYMRIMCPVNIRTENQKGALGNQVSAIFPMLPAWPMNSLERLQEVVTETQRIKQDEEAQAMTVLQEKMPNFPPLMMAVTQLVGTPLDPTALAAKVPLPLMPNIGYRPPNMGINFVCTNVPGMQVPQYMCGAEVTDTIGLLILMGNVGMSLTILSYNKQLFFNFIAEPRLLPDLEIIVDGANDVFNELLSAAQEKDAQINH